MINNNRTFFQSVLFNFSLDQFTKKKEFFPISRTSTDSTWIPRFRVFFISILRATKSRESYKKQNRNKFQHTISILDKKRSTRKLPICHDFRNYTWARLKPARLTRINLLVLNIRKSELRFVGFFLFFLFFFSLFFISVLDELEAWQPEDYQLRTKIRRIFSHYIHLSIFFRYCIFNLQSLINRVQLKALCEYWINPRYKECCNHCWKFTVIL